MYPHTAQDSTTVLFAVALAENIIATVYYFTILLSTQTHTHTNSAHNPVSLALGQSPSQPVQTFKEPVRVNGRTILNVPRVSPVLRETELGAHLRRFRRVWQVLFVGQDQDGRIAQVVVRQQRVQFLGGFRKASGVVGVDDKHEALRALVVVSPERTDFVLTTDIPNGKGHVVVLDRLYVKANRRDGCDVFSELTIEKERA